MFSSKRMKNLLVGSLFSLTLLGTLTGCGANPFRKETPISAINLDRTDVSIGDKAGVRVLVSNPFGHLYQYNYVADRGQVIADANGATAIYYAPFTGGPDTIRVSIFDKTDNINLPIITHQVMVQGESMAYVEQPNTVTSLSETDNGMIKVASIRGMTRTKEIGWGRNPKVSPDGRYVAYVTYPGDGSSQIIIKDPVGNETNITNHKSFNIDPSWSPIGSDGNLYLVFSSDRISSNSGNTGGQFGGGNVVSGHGERYHLWRVHSNGYDLRQITNTAGNDFQPNWSPDGKKIVFSSDLDTNKSNNFRNLWVLDVQSGKQVQVTHETMPGKGAFNPVWSPDGQKIAYSRKYQFRQLQNLANMQKIWMLDFGINTEGYGQIITRQYDESVVESFPSWSPDGRSVTYVRARGTESSLVSVDVGTISTTRGSFAEPMEEGGVLNITEANWSRQRSYGYYGSYPDLNNPFVPGPGTNDPNQPYNPYPNQYQQQYPQY